MRDFFGWWMNSVGSPYGKFVFVDHLVAVSVFCGVATAVLLGLFYKPDGYSTYSRFMDHYGFPLMLVVFSTVCLPIMSICAVFIFPFVLLLATPISGMMAIFISIKAYKKRLGRLQ